MTYEIIGGKVGTFQDKYVELKYTGELPNFTVTESPPNIRLSSGKIRTKAELDEFINTLSRFRSKLP